MNKQIVKDREDIDILLRLDREEFNQASEREELERQAFGREDIAILLRLDQEELRVKELEKLKELKLRSNPEQQLLEQQSNPEQEIALVDTLSDNQMLLDMEFNKYIIDLNQLFLIKK